MNEEELKNRIAELEAELKPLREAQQGIWHEQEQIIANRILKADKGGGDFRLDELRFAAWSRCSCGAGLCYPLKIGINGSWYCSDILRGIAIPSGQEGGKQHSDKLPFAFYEVKSEDQPSARGATTRPSEITKDPPIEKGG